MNPQTHVSESPVVFLSLGPGDSNLLTVRAVRALKQADVVLVPATRTADGAITSRAAAIISEWCNPGKISTFEVPMQRNREAVMAVYDQVCQSVKAKWQHSLKVVVAVEGDLSIYASVHYVMDRLQQQGVPVSQQPGITSFIAAAASASLSLASQDQRIVVLPGDAEAAQLEHLLANHCVVVIMKLSQCQQALKDYLLQHPHTACHYFEQVATPSEYHTSDIEEICARSFPYFSLCILYPAQ